MAVSATLAGEMLGQVLKQMKLITESQVQEALAKQRTDGGAIGGILVELGYITDDELTMALGAQVGMEIVDLEAILDDIPPDVIDRISPTMATIYKIVPVAFDEASNVLTVAMADSTKLESLDDLRVLLDCDVRGAVSNAAAVSKALEKYYADEQESIMDIISQLEEDSEALEVMGTASESIDLESLEEMANTAPVRKLLNLVLLQAIKDKASDIHFEPFEEEFKIRYRIDGVLYEMVPPPKQLSLALTSRIKVMSNLNIAERRRPQDGRVELNIGGNPVDLRISCLPTMFGESVVMRVLDRSVVSLDLDNLGMRTDEREQFRSLIKKPNGIILLTGPTGCGKTTTLYSALNEINDVGVKIITTEDPVEYNLDGIMQVQINEDAGVTFSRCLRHILRQDPDKILVGEIRDLETAEISVQASLTGHIVFSTLHTNDAPTTVTRLIDMGVDPYLITATLEAVIGQRLVRKICLDCKEEFQPSSEMLMELSLTPEDVRGKKFYYGRGCDKCNNTGYKGRMGIFEFMTLDDELRDVIMARGSTGQIRDVARRKGMRTLRESGLLTIYDGLTTIEEVVRETIMEEVT